MTHYVLKIQSPQTKTSASESTSKDQSSPICLIESDDWQVVRDTTHAQDFSAWPAYSILPLPVWRACVEGLAQKIPQDPRLNDYGVWIAPDDDVMQLAPLLEKSFYPALMAVDFPHWKDGRGYSHAYLLRQRLQWQGEIRAIGDVWRDQMLHMARSGVDVFAAANDSPEYLQASIAVFHQFNQYYQADVWQPLPLFRRS